MSLLDSLGCPTCTAERDPHHWPVEVFMHDGEWAIRCVNGHTYPPGDDRLRAKRDGPQVERDELDRLRAAVRPVEREGLDEGRLAEAIAAVDLALPAANDRERTHWRENSEQRENARAIAAEYERLAEFPR